MRKNNWTCHACRHENDGKVCVICETENTKFKTYVDVKEDDKN